MQNDQCLAKLEPVVNQYRQHDPSFPLIPLYLKYPVKSDKLVE